jgi:hypothetical protein
VIEAQGIPTLTIGTVRDIMKQVPPPRAVFVDHPVGRTFGRPGESARHEAVLADALAEIPNFTQSGQIRELECRWDADGSRGWEDELKAVLLETSEAKSD